MKRKGSRLADEIIQDINREKYFKQKVVRQKCLVDNKKQCDACKYRYNCEDVEEI